jgi:hypothetical protein
MINFTHYSKEFKEVYYTYKGIFFGKNLSVNKFERGEAVFL